MNKFGKASRKHLSTVDGRGQDVAHRVLLIKDHSIIQGHRNKEKQNSAFDAGYSKLRWADGKHNALPSLAMDVETYPRPPQSELSKEFEQEIEGNDNYIFKKVALALKEQPLRNEQFYLLGMYKGVASERGYPSRSGADFDRDGQVSDSTWFDLFHWELDL